MAEYDFFKSKQVNFYVYWVTLAVYDTVLQLF